MSTIVTVISNWYYDLYRSGEFNMDEARRILGKYDDVDRRVNYIKSVYDTVLGSSMINETTKLYIKSRKSYIEVARYYNSLHEQDILRTKEAESRGERINCPVHAKTEALVKADICYTNKKLKNVLGCDIPDYSMKDYFSIVMWKSEMEDYLWLKADEALEVLKAMCNGSLLSKEAFWLNIPVREFHRDLSEDEFNHLVDLIKPYFTVQKSLAQKELNDLKRESGYLNYILRADMELNEVDAARRDFILELAEGRQTKDVSDCCDPEQEPENSEVALLQKQLDELKAVEDVEQEKRVKLMSKIGFIYYSNKSGIYTEKEINMIEAFEKEYEQLKALETDRQEQINVIQKRIEKLKESDAALEE